MIGVLFQAADITVMNIQRENAGDGQDEKPDGVIGRGKRDSGGRQIAPEKKLGQKRGNDHDRQNNQMVEQERSDHQGKKESPGRRISGGYRFDRPGRHHKRNRRGYDQLSEPSVDFQRIAHKDAYRDQQRRQAENHGTARTSAEPRGENKIERGHAKSRQA